MWGCTYNGAGLGHWLFGGGIFGFGLTALIVIIIAALVLKIAKAPHHKKNENLDTLDSLMILKNRFAKGEITEQEYQKMKQTLSV
ncbi:SHOCT domain-containing protein [Desulfoluna butyratoxydans]|uniref:Shoct domain n=1 Tax=Desulfoluna butyratoxydans TaxID=231438 RepID=A0A4U8YIJ7_9BACT|nr:SHOCT domain-containing protein [Desulfoluna butyratoxydans]VFQ43486.1 shoct domain [Desulfoluna butyratoxydans]